MITIRSQKAVFTLPACAGNVLRNVRAINRLIRALQPQMKTQHAMTFVTEPERRIPIAGKFDVIVAGGGPAGMAAALAAARSGARVKLLEAHGCLGGVWTAGLLTWMFEMDQPGIPREISRRLDERGARTGIVPDMYSYDPEAMKLLLEEMCAEAGIGSCLSKIRFLGQHIAPYVSCQSP